MLLGTLGASSLGNMLAGIWMVGAGSGNTKGKGIVTAGYENEMDFWFCLILLQTLKYLWTKI